jgi:outer membrane autotransporter protein
LQLGLGLAVRWDLPSVGDTHFSPQLHVGYRHDLTQDRVETHSSFTGAPGIGSFRTVGAEPDGNIFHLGAGLGIFMNDTSTLRIGYDAELQKDRTTHSAFLQWVTHF